MTSKERQQRRVENARRVARRMLCDAKGLRDARVAIELYRIEVESLRDENEELRNQLRRALTSFYAPDFDGAEMPGELPVRDLAEIASDVGLRVRPKLEPVAASAANEGEE